MVGWLVCMIWNRMRVKHLKRRVFLNASFVNTIFLLWVKIKFFFSSESKLLYCYMFINCSLNKRDLFINYFSNTYLNMWKSFICEAATFKLYLIFTISSKWIQRIDFKEYNNLNFVKIIFCSNMDKEFLAFWNLEYYKIYIKEYKKFFLHIYNNVVDNYQ